MRCERLVVAVKLLSITLAVEVCAVTLLLQSIRLVVMFCAAEAALPPVRSLFAQFDLSIEANLKSGTPCCRYPLCMQGDSRCRTQLATGKMISFFRYSTHRNR
jgi:hypothetical protein